MMAILSTDQPGQGKVVGYEEVGKFFLVPQVHHQPQYTRPDQGIQHGNRFVGHNE